MLDFVRNYPLRHYARGVLRRVKPAHAAFLLQPDRLSAALPVAGEMVFKEKLEKQTGALSLAGNPKSPAAFVGGAFAGKERLEDGRWVVVVDTPNFAAEVIDTASKPNVQSLTQVKRLSDPRTLIEYLDPQSAKRFLFEPVGLDLRPLTEDKLPPKFLYVGLDREIQTRVETWFAATRQHLAAIVPMQLAALAAVREIAPRPGLHVVSSPNSTTIGLFTESGLRDCAFTMALGESVPYEDFAGGLQDMALHYALEKGEPTGTDPVEVRFYGCGLTPTQVENHVAHLRKHGLEAQSVPSADFADPTSALLKGKTHSFDARLLGVFLTGGTAAAGAKA